MHKTDAGSAQAEKARRQGKNSMYQVTYRGWPARTQIDSTVSTSFCALAEIFSCKTVCACTRVIRRETDGVPLYVIYNGVTDGVPLYDAR